jgi:hypothetical protein
MRTYANTYLNPVVLGQIMTNNDERFSVFWSRGTSKSNPPSASALWVGKHIGEDPDTVRSQETTGYIVFEAGSGMISGHEFLAGIGGDSIRGITNGPPFSYALSGLSSASVAVVSSAGMDGGDGGWPVLYGQNPVTSSNLNLAIDEDQLKDTERSHTTEQESYTIFE